MTAPVLVASYNVHGFVGRDGRRDPDRVAAVLDEIDADVAALQEVDASPPRTATLELELLGAVRDRRVVAGPTMRRRGGEYGNAVLTRLEVEGVRRHDLTVAGREPRGALDLDLATPGGAQLRLVTTHLGLRRRERRRQASALLEAIATHGDPADPILLVGDLNEWWPRGGPLAILGRWLAPTAAPATFPARRPLLPLDRGFERPRGIVRSVAAHRSELTREASDHLPLVVRTEPGRFPASTT